MLVSYEWLFKFSLHALEPFRFLIFFFVDYHVGEQKEKVTNMISCHNNRVLKLRHPSNFEENIRRKLRNNEQHLFFRSWRLGQGNLFFFLNFLLGLLYSYIHGLGGEGKNLLLLFFRRWVCGDGGSLNFYFSGSDFSLQGKRRAFRVFFHLMLGRKQKGVDRSSISFFFMLACRTRPGAQRVSSVF